MRVHERGENELVRAGMADVAERTPIVQIDVCRCGHAHAAGSPHAGSAPLTEPPAEAEWALASAWSWLTRPVEDDEVAVLDEAAEVDDVDEDVPWWDARARPERRRAMLGVVLLGELQAGVLLRAVWEVVQSSPSGPLA